MKLKIVGRAIRQKLRTVPKWLWVVAIAFGLAGLVGVAEWRSSVQRQRAAQAANLQLERDRQALAEKQKNTATHTEDHPDVVQLQFKDVSQNYTRASCKRLENRRAVIITSNSCEYRLRAFGKVRVAMVYVYENFLSPEHKRMIGNNNPDDKNSLGYINTYLKKQAARYKVDDPLQLEFTSFGPYKLTTPVRHLYYRNDSYKIMDAFNEASKQNKVPEENYDAVEFILMDGSHGGIAYPQLHRAFSYNSWVPQLVAIVTHETLHLFGASDKYNNNDCNTIGTSDPFGRYSGLAPGADIMCWSLDLDYSNINDITAREIGWGN